MFNQLLPYILEANPYFDNGFDDVYQDETTGIVHNSQPIFPNDTLGNYFYLRLPNNIRFDSSNIYQLEECANTPAKVYDAILVACVADSNPNTLLNNLLSTLAKFGDIGFGSASVQSEVVIRQELQKMSKESIDKALQNKPDISIVSIQFTYTETMQLNNCIVNPCVACS